MIKRKKKSVLFLGLDRTDAEREWVGMPEFVHEERKPFREIKIRFTCDEDVEQFAKDIGHTVTPKTTYIWYSEVSFKGRNLKRRYIDES